MILGKAISPLTLRKKNGSVPTDADAQAFITATGISGTNATATNKLVIDLKAANIWTKMKCIYPFVGNTSASQKYNLKDPRDLDIAYRLAFGGGGTFSSNGYQPNGTNAYADTWLVASTALSLNNTHFSYYSRTNNALIQLEAGCNDGVNLMALALNYQGVGSFADQYNISSRVSTAQSNSQGLFLTSRVSSNSHKLYKNGAQIGTTNTSAGGSLPSLKIVLAGRNLNNVVDNYSSKQCAFASIGDGLTDAEALALYNAVQLFNTTLNRQV
jgi:hypothetical protein